MISKGLRLTFDINTLLTFAAFAILVATPHLLPAGIGITTNDTAQLIGLMLGAAEWGLATMTLLGRRLKDMQALRTISLGVAVFHLATAGVLLYIFFSGQSDNPVGLWANVLIPRLGIAAACIYFGLYRNPLGLQTHKK